jgi:peptidyl-dipeptidase A
VAVLRAEPKPVPVVEQPKPAPVLPTVAEARAFIEQTEAQLRAAWSQRERQGFVQNTYITYDTELLSAQGSEQVMELESKKIKEASRFDGVSLPVELRRKFDNLKNVQVLASPPEPGDRSQLAQIAAEMEGYYGKAQYCPQKLQVAGQPPKCLKLDDLEKTLRQSKSYDELLDAWQGWHEQAKALRGPYTRYIALANKGAVSQGYADTGALWRAKYDMPPEAFSQEVERLWSQVEPLYKALHCYTRMKLHATYGAKVPETGPIPAHLLGNMWAQQWGNLYPLLAPAGKGHSLDIGAVLKNKKTTPQGLVKYGENFFTSLGLDPLPDTFWQRSMFVRPRDRDVVCHASAWDLSYHGDLRLKMCIELDEENFRTVHHELGHDYYYWYYRDLSPLLQGGANDGFHEGIGDSIALSITPAYLKKVGLLDQVTESPADDVAFLLRDALDRVAFLPFGKLIDQWRWEVFSGKIGPEELNTKWWELRARIQGIAPPTPRGEEFFDPGAKYHIPANVPYMRYFLAHILMFQFHRALCQASGYTGPLYKCSVYGNRAAGERLKTMLQLGASKPWPEALRAIAGTDQMNADALLEYYQPLSAWLAEQTKSQKCGW